LCRRGRTRLAPGRLTNPCTKRSAGPGRV
jgi:hypothetical protein